MPPGVSFTKELPPGKSSIYIGDSPDAFNYIHKYLHDPSVEVDDQSLPAVCKLAKKLQFDEVLCVFTRKLAESLNLTNIGESCSLIHLGRSETCSPACNKESQSLSCLAAERELADATRKFLLNNADAVACSQTGQLSARLYVDFVFRSGVEILPIPISPDSAGEDFVDSACPAATYLNFLPTAPDWSPKLSDFQFAERILNIFLERISNNGPIEGKDIGRKFREQLRTSAKDTVTEEIRIKIKESQLHEYSRNKFSKFAPSSAPLLSKSGNSSETTDCQRVLLPNVTAETETCLIAQTNLSVGSISIYLGKLDGRLVSLSLKRQPCSNFTSSSSLSRSSSLSTVPNISVNSVVLPPSPLSKHRTALNSCSQDDLPPANSLYISVMENKPASVPNTSPYISPGNFFVDETFLTGNNCTVLRSFGQLAGRLSRGRSAAGACNLMMPHTPTTFQSDTSVLLAGGFTQNGCLSSVECLHFSSQMSAKSCHFSMDSYSEEVSTPDSIFDGISIFEASEIAMKSQSGPPMQQARGRLAMAITEASPSVDAFIYACGGCDGSNDLASSECLSVSTLQSWLLNSPSKHPIAKDPSQESLISLKNLSQTTTSPWKPIANLQQARSYAAATTFDRFRITVLGGQFVNKPLSSVEIYESERDEWIYLPPMLEARSQLCSTTVHDRNLILAVGGMNTMSKCSFLESTQSLYDSDFCSLSATAEAYDRRCRDWIRLPDLINRSPLVGATILPIPFSGRILLIGGSDGHSASTQTQIFDPRSWTWLCGPSLSIGRCSPCAVRLYFGLAVFGGYNVAAGGFLDSVEFIGSSRVSSPQTHAPVPLNLLKQSSEFGNLQNDVFFPGVDYIDTFQTIL